jgi:DNA-binding GntR family transcriptional regulator
MIDCREKVAGERLQNPFLPVHEIVCNILREKIIDCELRPGERLKEDSLAESMGVSRTTVRNSIETLLKEGLLVKRPTRGVEVAALSERTYMNLVELRLMMDPFAGELAALRRTDRDLEILRKCIEDMATTSDQAVYGRADIGFHNTIYNATQNPFLIRIYQIVTNDMARFKMYGSARMMNSGRRDRIVREHKEIYQALRDKDKKRAYEACLKHAKITLEPDIIRDSVGYKNIHLDM